MIPGAAQSTQDEPYWPPYAVKELKGADAGRRLFIYISFAGKIYPWKVMRDDAGALDERASQGTYVFENYWHAYAHMQRQKRLEQAK